MGWSAKAPPPDPKIGEAAAATAQLGREAFEWYKNYTDTVLTPQENEEAALNKRVIDQAMDIAGDQQTIANETYDYQKGTFRPLEQGIVADATNFSTRDYGDRKAAQAAAEVEQAMSQARAASARDQARMGIAPSAGVAAALDQNMALKAAAAKAGAATGARDNAEQMGFARRMDAASLGRGLPSQQAAAAQTALSGGAQAAGTLAQEGQGLRQNAATMGQGFQTGIGAQQAAGGLYQAAYATNSANINAANAARMGMIGTALGAGAGMYATKR